VSEKKNTNLYFSGAIVPSAAYILVDERYTVLIQGELKQKRRINHEQQGTESKGNPE